MRTPETNRFGPLLPGRTVVGNVRFLRTADGWSSTNCVEKLRLIVEFGADSLVVATGDLVDDGRTAGDARGAVSMASASSSTSLTITCCAGSTVSSTFRTFGRISSPITARSGSPRLIRPANRRRRYLALPSFARPPVDRHRSARCRPDDVLFGTHYVASAVSQKNLWRVFSVRVTAIALGRIRFTKHITRRRCRDGRYRGEVWGVHPRRA